MEIVTLSNGKTSLERADKFLNDCVAAPIKEIEIESILREELEGFFEGSKNAQETAEVIQRRVQLLINEQ